MNSEARKLKDEVDGELTFETEELEPEPRRIKQFTLTPDERIEQAFFKLTDTLKQGIS